MRSVPNSIRIVVHGFDRKTPHTGDMRQMVDDLERMGATKKSVHETLVDCQEHARMVYRQTVQGFGVPRHMLGRDR